MHSLNIKLHLKQNLKIALRLSHYISALQIQTIQQREREASVTFYTTMPEGLTRAE